MLEPSSKAQNLPRPPALSPVFHQAPKGGGHGSDQQALHKPSLGETGRAWRRLLGGRGPGGQVGVTGQWGPLRHCTALGCLSGRTKGGYALMLV